MSMYKLLNRYKPIKLQQANSKEPFEEAITLKQYMLFEHEETKDRYVLLKLKSTLKHSIDTLSFELREVNQDKAIIRISSYEFKDLTLTQKGDIILPNKFKILNNCEKIIVTITNVTTKAYEENDTKTKDSQTTGKNQ